MTAVAPSDELLAKAERYLLTQKIQVRIAEKGLVATAQGDSGTWAITRHEDGSYRCSCPATGLCSHLWALSYVAGTP